MELTSGAVPTPLRVRLHDPSALRESYARLGEAVAQALEECRGYYQIPPAIAGRLLGKIASAGRIFLSHALIDPRSAYADMAGFFLKACPFYRFPQAQVPAIHIVVDSGDYFPWELLPLFNPVDPVVVDDQPSLEDACLRFPGFRTVVERRNITWSESSDYLDATHSLPVRVMYNAGYEGALAEVGFFQAQEHVTLEGPFPQCVDDAREPSFAHQISDPRIGLNGELRPHGDEIVHITCHCDSAYGTSSGKYAFHLADDQDRPLVIALDELLDELMTRWASNPLPKAIEKKLPMVFLNACGTNALDPATASSLLKPFYDNRNRCIVATAGNVADRMAADVSRWFYRSLFEGSTVGEALHAAKWRLLQDRGNPLGLLYSVHAFAGLRVLPIPA
jgi:hypothetical protein